MPKLYPKPLTLNPKKAFTLLELIVARHPKLQRRKAISGFTLIELVVVISIIGILTTIGIATYGTAQQKARDTRRKEDLKALQSALILYYQDYDKFPSADTTNDEYFASNGTTSWIPGLQDYLKEPISDPSQSGILTSLAKIFNFGKNNQNIGQVASSHTSAIVGQWKFDNGNLVNEIDNINATLIGTSSSIVPGHDATPNGAINLPTGTYVQIAHKPAFMPPSLTVSLWYNPSSCQLICGRTYLVRKDLVYRLTARNAGGVGDNKFRFAVRPQGSSSWTEVATANFSITEGIWFHVAGTYDGSRICIYVNGATPNCTTVSSPLNSSTTNIDVGVTDNGASAIDDLRIYNKVLIQGDIQQDMGSLPASPSPTPITLPSPSPSATPVASPVTGSTTCQTSNVYCYQVSADKLSFILWAQLENGKDPSRIGGANPECIDTPPTGSLLNYCLKSPVL